MSGPRITFDAHNYLSMNLCAGPSWEDDVQELPVEEHEAAEKELEAMEETGFCIDWDSDPEEFAKNLEGAARWLRKVAALKLPEGRFHIRTDID